MLNDLKQWIEDVVEKKNWIIQVIYLLILIIISIIFEFDAQTTDKIIVELLFAIAGELFIFGIKDSILQKKINRMDAKQDIDLGRLFRVADFNLDPFFVNASHNIFVSGIALNGFFRNCQERMKDFLGRGKRIYLLFLSPELVEECAKLYFGANDEKKVREVSRRVIRYQMETVENIMQEFSQSLSDGKIEVRISHCIFSTSFVAYDFMKPSDKGVREIKASFYQYGCRQPEREPNILLRTDDKREWYNFFENTMKEQWNDAEKIETMIEARRLYDELQALYEQYNR